MSKGIKISNHSSDEELNALKGARIFQITTPSQKYFGFEIHNYDNTLCCVNRLPGDKLEIELDGVAKTLVVYSAVLTYELTGLAAIADFGKE